MPPCKRLLYWFSFCLLFTIHLHAQAVELSPEITYFYDGDTVKIRDAFSEYKLRLSDIDAPERNQSYGKTSRRALIKLCKNAAIKVSISGVDKYQRNVGKLICNDQDASVYMIENGYAWFNRRYSMNYSLDRLEQQSRNNRKGLWKRKKPFRLGYGGKNMLINTVFPSNLIQQLRRFRLKY